MLVVSAGEGTALLLERLQRAGRSRSRAPSSPVGCGPPARFPVSRGKRRPPGDGARARGRGAARRAREGTNAGAPGRRARARSLAGGPGPPARARPGVLRWKSALDAEIAGDLPHPLQKLTPNLREIMEVALYQVRHLDRIPPYAAVNAAVDQARPGGGEGAAKLVNGVLRNILLLPPADTPPPGGRGGRRGTRALLLPSRVPRRALARALRPPRRTARDPRGRQRAAPPRPAREPAPDDPRRPRARRSRRRRRDGALAVAPLALTVLSGNPLRSPLLSPGHFSVQDVGSQLLPLLLPEGDCSSISRRRRAESRFPPSRTAARGGPRRSTAPAAPRRVTENARRLGLPEVRAVAADFARAAACPGRFDAGPARRAVQRNGHAAQEPRDPLPRHGRGDRPARRARRRRLSPRRGLLAPGGYLLYSTCSLEEEENERVVARVLAGAPGLEPAPIDAPPGLAPFVDGARFRLFPDDRADGFTAHLLRRR